ncbi:hypothetical protein [Sulfitobacter aestuariivivens]|uniref:Uncharacterized protein n=1 Tax=Sulfitobacter aestuariivivens TaxID=2766981 RepID=A0A927D1H3_9RHOB|nr:hypothetical protein [Sulfitobacter aestuariivivens]MBD3663289.1 hypothetical protein [Sulfitobacter aestuariivivens]
MADTPLIQMAHKLAEDCLKVQAEIGDDRLFMELGEAIGTSSQTLEEAFLTAVRTQMANEKARHFLAEKLKAHRDGKPTE